MHKEVLSSDPLASHGIAHIGGRDLLFRSKTSSSFEVFRANDGSRSSVDGLAMAGRPWILPLLACMKADVLTDLES